METVCRACVVAWLSTGVLFFVSAARAQPAPELGWVAVPAGTFEMGCVPADTECLPSERPRHLVTLSQSFELMATEVTVAQFLMFTRASGHRLPPRPNFLQTGRHPIVLINWHDARAFCEWAGGRLPTEAEWEYAARADHPDRIFDWGDDVPDRWVNHGVWNGGTVSGEDRWLNTAPVGSFPPNDFGLYDMSGNVWEWVADAYVPYPDREEVDPLPSTDGALRVARGGSWFNPPSVLRLSVRLVFDAEARTSNVGVRCARDMTSLVASE